MMSGLSKLQDREPVNFIFHELLKLIVVSFLSGPHGFLSTGIAAVAKVQTNRLNTYTVRGSNALPFSAGKYRAKMLAYLYVCPLLVLLHQFAIVTNTHEMTCNVFCIRAQLSLPAINTSQMNF